MAQTELICMCRLACNRLRSAPLLRRRGAKSAAESRLQEEADAATASDSQTEGDGGDVRMQDDPLPPAGRDSSAPAGKKSSTPAAGGRDSSAPGAKPDAQDTEMRDAGQGPGGAEDEDDSLGALRADTDEEEGGVEQKAKEAPGKAAGQGKAKGASTSPQSKQQQQTNVAGPGKGKAGPRQPTESPQQENRPNNGSETPAGSGAAGKRAKPLAPTSSAGSGRSSGGRGGKAKRPALTKLGKAAAKALGKRQKPAS